MKLNLTLFFLWRLLAVCGLVLASPEWFNVIRIETKREAKMLARLLLGLIDLLAALALLASLN